MKKKISLILVLCMVAALLAGCGSSSSGSSKSSDSSDNEDLSIDLDTSDLLVEHTVFLMDEDEGYREYDIVYYGHDTHGLKKLSTQIQFDKAAGYTEEHVSGINIEDVYPGFNSMSFASKQILDDGDFITLVLTFDDLDDMDNVAAMEANGLITTDDTEDATMVDADSYMDSLRSNGGREVSGTDDAYLTLHF